MKSNNKFSRFTTKELEKVSLVFGLMALAHNLRKLAARKNADKNRGAMSKPTEQKNCPIIFFNSIRACYHRGAA